MWCTTKPIPKILKLGSSTLEESPEMSITVSTNSPDGTSRSAPLSRFLKNGGSFGKSTFSKPFTLEGREIDIEIVDDNDNDNDLETDAVVCEIEEYDEEYEEGGSPYQLGQDDYVYKNGNSQVADLLKKYGTEMKRPNGMMMYRCEVCTKTFDHKRYLTSHMVSHTTNAHFVCNICSRGFKRKQELRRHYDGIHAKVRPFKCKLCFSEFQLRYGLTRHLQSGCPKAKKRKEDALSTLTPTSAPVPQLKTISKPSQLPAPVVPVMPQSFNLLSLIQRAANSKVVTQNVQTANIMGNKMGANSGNVDMTPKTLAVDNGQGSVLLINLVPVPGGLPAQSSATAITTTTTSVITTTSSIAMITDPSNKSMVKTITSIPALKPATVSAIIKTAPSVKREPVSPVTVKQEPATSVIVKQRPTSVIVKREVEDEAPDGVDVSYESYFTCAACCKNFLTKEKLALHERVCKNQQNKAQVLQKFYKSQIKREDLTCDLCTRTFRDEQYLQMHFSTCPGYKSKIQGQPASEFQCDICLKCFTRKSDLKRHGLVHTKARPFVCSICGQSFQFNYVLYRHYLFCHPDEAAQQTDDEYLQEQVSAAAAASRMGNNDDSN